MRIWRSVVGKLWMTILLLVCFVLFILTILLLEFFQNYHVEEVEETLRYEAQKSASILEDHDDLDMSIQIVAEVLDDPVHSVVEMNDDIVFYSDELSYRDTLRAINNSQLMDRVYADGTVVQDEFPSGEDFDNRYNNIMIVGAPVLNANGEAAGAVYVYQSLEAIQQTTEQTTRLIILAAAIAIILTTIFAFFLSTRITAPLRKMREGAFEVARGKFDTKVPILSNDEIGELATAFNQMGRQLKHHLDALSQEKEQLSSVLSSMADGVITFNKDLTVLVSNPPAERFLQNWYDEQDGYTKLALPPTIEQLIKEVMQTNEEQVGELEVNGRSYAAIISPLYSGQTVRGAVAVLRDMTEERKLETLRKDFIANVSHELRTPISMLQGYSEAIIDDIPQSDEERKDIAKVIYDESLRMGRLVNELLDLARMEAGHIVLNKEEVKVNEFSSRVLSKFKLGLNDHDIMLSYETELNESTVILIDPDRIEQVLTNLLDNAIRHTKADGKIIIKTRRENQFIRFDVIDNGVGIPEEDLPFIFERFYKADKARTRGRAGTGLGLAIVKNLIEAHKGKIKAESKVDKGTVFSFFLPFHS
ncbi:ATP-binding protein [Jeotgalibacillus haloalkalitolerans]|uniref:histidine kinase n=1 Tax=Jeotgalibacillus haloalkalitolerans TaxID=3104292 RepID=A0ABU5KL99_9BACL|nr:ATP-binding protein [Jeotgalibacillus sp. HH7-29]MDZ5712044.1 ATP-binding protein [Jeotgalibacillus sp. HH7-29]